MCVQVFSKYVSQGTLPAHNDDDDDALHLCVSDSDASTFWWACLVRQAWQPCLLSAL